jgi:serine/threonine protein kinase
VQGHAQIHLAFAFVHFLLFLLGKEKSNPIKASRPYNIFLDTDVAGALVTILADFGIATVLEGGKVSVDAFETIRIVGASIAYAAPEVMLRLRNSGTCKEFVLYWTSSPQVLDLCFGARECLGNC